jgi:DNA-binding CsgD family transcriptional regulator
MHSSIKNLLGHTPEDIVDKGFLFYKEIIHPKDFSYLVNEIVTVIQITNYEVSKNEICLPVNIRHKNGHWVGLKVHVSYLKDLKNKKLDILFGFLEKDQELESESSSTPFNVSVREKEVLKKLAAGNSAKTIASELSISESTVITHRKNLIQKLKVKNSAELIKRSFELNILN